MATAQYAPPPAIDLTAPSKQGKTGTMSTGTSVTTMADPQAVGPKVQAVGVQQPGMRIPTGALGQGVARPPLPNQTIESAGIIGRQMINGPQLRQR
jgi:hypothetical protein